MSKKMFSFFFDSWDRIETHQGIKRAKNRVCITTVTQSQFSRKIVDTTPFCTQ